MHIDLLSNIWIKIQQSNKYFYFFLLLLLLVVQATAFGNASTPIWTIGSSSTTAGFSGVAESPADLSFVSNGTASTFTITVPAGHQYVEIETNGFDADLDAFEFTCPTSSGGTGSSGGTSSTIACNASSGEIVGLVWLDVDFDGINDAAETRGFENVTVTVYDASGAVVGSALTLADGSYSIAGLTDNVTYRVEFSNLPAASTETTIGTDNGSSVQFLQTGSCANLGLAYPADYCQTNPPLTTNCYVPGDPLQTTGDSHDADVIVTIDYNSVGEFSDNDYDAFSDQVGSTWGLGYQRSTQRVFAGAFIKRHTGIGPAGEDAIYVLDYGNLDANGNPTTSTFVNLNNLGISTGTVGTGATPAARNLSRGLTDDVTDGSDGDPLAFAPVGKVGIGDVDVSEDEQTLYVMSLDQQTLYAITIDADNNPATAPTAADVIGYPVPNECSTGENRPFAIDVHEGEVYVGSVCEEELTSFVYQLQSNGTFQQVFQVPLTYEKGTVFNSGDCGDETFWYTWTDTYPAACRGDNVFVYPQAILSDIEIDEDGSFILGYMDRFGHQAGYGAERPTGGSEFGFSSGDILRICNVAGTYVIEGASTVCANNDNNGEGPNGGEFYYEDRYNNNHHETSLGGLALLTGTGEVALTAFDPFGGNNGDQGGINWFDNTTGEARDENYAIYFGISGDGFFGKAAGLGDLEALCESAPITIGNYVWIDTDMDGIQDPNEIGIASLTVELWADTDGDGIADTKVAETTTDANGNYQFSMAGTNGYGQTEDWSFFGTDNDEMEPNTDYEIRIPTSQTALTGLSLTTTNAGGNSSNDATSDINDSDVTTSGTDAVIAYRTGAIGNNFGLDAGFFEAPTCTNPDLVTTPATICVGDNVDISTLVTDNNNVGGTTAFYASLTDANAQTSSLSTTTVAPIIDTKYYVREDTTGCFDIDSIQIVVNGLPTAVVEDVLKCTTNAETIEVSPSGGTAPYTYTWSGPFNTNPGNVASFTASNPGIYSVTVMDSEGCTITTNGELTIQPIVCLPATFTIRRGSRN